MTVKLSERAEQIVRDQIEAGYFSSPVDVVDFALLEHFSTNELSYEEVEASLLAAVREPTVPYREGEFVEMIMSAIRDRNPKG